jgi:hypothetical protein
MRFHSLLTKFSPLAIAALVGFSGCSTDLSAPVDVSSDANLSAWQNQSTQDATPDILASIDIEGAYDQSIIYDGTNAKLTGALAKALRFAETNDDDDINETFGRRGKWLVKSGLVIADETTVIEFGTDKVGYSTITFPDGAVEEDVVVTIVHKLKGKRDIFFFPDMTFGEDVTLQFSLEGLNNRQKKNLENLRLWFHDPDADGWVLIPSSSDGEWVTATLEHFSRYAVGSDE